MRQAPTLCVPHTPRPPSHAPTRPPSQSPIPRPRLRPRRMLIQENCARTATCWTCWWARPLRVSRPSRKSWPLTAPRLRSASCAPPPSSTWRRSASTATRTATRSTAGAPTSPSCWRSRTRSTRRSRHISMPNRSSISPSSRVSTRSTLATASSPSLRSSRSSARMPASSSWAPRSRTSIPSPIRPPHGWRPSMPACRWCPALMSPCSMWRTQSPFARRQACR
mmetsp:Transcript_1180/g.2481  ORF Transcript_1180/g.2481 Transcript_1180/m.2481 type:complete len:223 (-) Transcript_1180:127-795(-)